MEATIFLLFPKTVDKNLIKENFTLYTIEDVAHLNVTLLIDAQIFENKKKTLTIIPFKNNLSARYYWKKSRNRVTRMKFAKITEIVDTQRLPWTGCHARCELYTSQCYIVNLFNHDSCYIRACPNLQLVHHTMNCSPISFKYTVSYIIVRSWSIPYIKSQSIS